MLDNLGKKIENFSQIHDHNLVRSILRFCILILGLFTAHGCIYVILYIVLEISGTIKDLKKTSAISEKAVPNEPDGYYVFAKVATSLDASF